jgi:phosphohistidine phosphatase SixA
MKRRLILMRHAKSSWKKPELPDRERPLNKRGRRDAPRVARRLAELGWMPEVVLSSDSIRTRQTADLLVGDWKEPPAVDFLPSFYHGGVDELVEELSAVPSAVQCVLALGHNPGWEGALLWLTGDDGRLTTANAALLESEGDTWAAAAAGRRGWKTYDIIRPKELD